VEVDWKGLGGTVSGNIPAAVHEIRRTQ
jgi:hypothetical protein